MNDKCDHEHCPVNQELDGLKAQITDIREKMDELLAAWNGAKGVVLTIKWLSVIAAGVGAMVAALTAWK